MKKKTLKRIIDSEDSKKEKIDKLKKRHKYLASKSYKDQASNQMKYIKYHLKRLGG